jgi:DNA repair protein RadC
MSLEDTRIESAEGHRKRLREKFIKSGLDGFADYEIVELLLTLGSPRRDCKLAAKEAIRQFHTLRGVLEAPPEKLQEIAGIGPHNAFGIKLVQEIARKFLKEKLVDRPVYSSSAEMFDYLYHTMRGLKKEIFKVIFLNNQHQIIEAIDVFHGTINTSFVSPREIIEGALQYNAAAMIFAHNHPSGNPAPSESDRLLTRDLVYAACIMKLKVLDHLIIGDNRFTSLAGQGLIEKYEMEFSNLKISGVAETGRALQMDKPQNGLPWNT